MSNDRNEIKPDWDEAVARLRDWWAGRRIDRAVAAVYAPKAGARPQPARAGLPDKYTDFETISINFESQWQSTFYGGEALPLLWLYHGPVPMSAYFGGEPEFRPDTVWYAPRYDNWEAARTWTFDPQNRWWQMALELTRRSLDRAAGRYLVSGCGLCGLADVIANLWGAEALMEQLALAPDTIADLRDRMLAAFRTMYDQLDALTRPDQEGGIDWLGVWGPGRVCSLQDDVSCMVSPDTFRAVFLEEIRQEARHVDQALYHLDGPAAIRHLDALLSIPELHVIQWTPGAGASEDPLDWLDLFRRIQAAGKKVFIYCPPRRVRELLSRIDRQAVYLQISCPDEATARQCLAELDRIGG